MDKRSPNKFRITLVILGAFALAFAYAPFRQTLADTMTSTDFMMQDGIVDMFGGYSSSTDFQVVTGGTSIISGDATSSHFGSNTGPVNYSQYTPNSENWRWYSDANDETPVSALSSENVAPSNIPDFQAIKLRVTIKEESGLYGAAAVKYGLEYSLSSNFSSSVAFVTEAGSCVVTSTWCYATTTSGGIDNGIITTALLSTSGACSGGVGVGCGTHNTSAISISTSTQSSGGVVPGTTYYFRPVYMADEEAVPLTSTSSYPSLVMQGAALSFTVSGIVQGTSTYGVTTSVSSTPISLPFGALSVATSEIAAQQLTVTTNAQNGYELYALEDAAFKDGSGDVLPGVAGTNPSPLAWATGCVSTSTGCYGYHAGSPVLSGGSTRFAPNDTYAKLTTSSAEVGYSAYAVASATMDMVYRIEANGSQKSGSYQNNVIYIVAPSF